jgi:hypothetical protein
VWRIRITKRTSADLPRVVGKTTAMTSDATPDAAGAIWTLDVSQRHLDANIIYLQPYGRLAAHTGPDLDVLAGAGRLTTETDRVTLRAGRTGLAASPITAIDHRRTDRTALPHRAPETSRADRLRQRRSRTRQQAPLAHRTMQSGAHASPAALYRTGRIFQ